MELKADLVKPLLAPLMEKMTPRRSGMVDYLSAQVLPTLLPALRSLTRAAERLDAGLAAAREGSEGMAFDTKSAPLRVFVTRNVTPELSRGLELCYREQPSDAIDFLAKFLFERSGDDAGGGDDDDEEQLNPLHWLGQYLMRHNPNHPDKCMPSQASPRLFRPLAPTKLRDPRAPSPERRASPRTYPAAMEPSYERVDATTLRLYRENHRFKVGLEESAMVLEILRDEVAHRVTFECTVLATKKTISRTLGEDELMGLLSDADKWKVGINTAALEMAPKVRILKKKYASSLKIGFAGTRETAVERLTSTTRRCEGKLYVVDILREPHLGGDRKAAEERGDLCTLRFRAYLPETSSYIETAVAGQRLSRDARKAKDQVLGLVDRVDVVALPDCSAHVLVRLHTPYETDMLGASGDGKRTRVRVATGVVASDGEDGREARMVASVVDLWANGEAAEGQDAPPRPPPTIYLLLPEAAYEGALDLAQAMEATAPPLQALARGLRFDSGGALAHTSMVRAKSLVARRFEEALGAAATLKKGEVHLGVDCAGRDVSYKYDQKIVDRRDALWSLRRDQALLDLQRGGDAGGVLVYRAGVQLSDMYMLVSLYRVSTSVTGKLRFTAYEPTQCAQLELAADHVDTRPFGCAGPGKPLRGAAKALAKALCGRLKVENSDKGRGPPALSLWEKDPVTTKMRRAFDGLPKDARGRAAKGDVVDLFAVAKNELDHFLAPQNNKPKLPPIVGFDQVNACLETAKRRVELDTHKRVDFATFAKALEDP